MPDGPFGDASLRDALMAALAEHPAQAETRPAAPPPETGMGKAAMLTAILGQAADIGTTLPMIASDRFKESNSIPLPLLMGIKGGLMATPWLFKKLGVGRTPSNIAGFGVGAAGAIPAAMNLRTLAKADE